MSEWKLKSLHVPGSRSWTWLGEEVALEATQSVAGLRVVEHLRGDTRALVDLPADPTRPLSEQLAAALAAGEAELMPDERTAVTALLRVLAGPDERRR